MNRPALSTYAFFLLIVVGGGLAIGLFNTPGGWYAGLEKPPFNPPNWLFGPVWTILYVLIAIVGARTWRRAPNGTAMWLWWAQLALNFLWSPVFFTVHAVALALAVVVALVVAVLGFILSSWRDDHPSAAMFLPYLAWVSFASLLNAAILWLN